MTIHTQALCSGQSKEILPSTRDWSHSLNKKKIPSGWPSLFTLLRNQEELTHAKDQVRRDFYLFTPSIAGDVQGSPQLSSIIDR